MIVEPSAAITLAGFFEYRDKFPDLSKICFVITGSLVDPRMVDEIISQKGLASLKISSSENFFE